MQITLTSKPNCLKGGKYGSRRPAQILALLCHVVARRNLLSRLPVLSDVRHGHRVQGFLDDGRHPAQPLGESLVQTFRNVLPVSLFRRTAEEYAADQPIQARLGHDPADSARPAAERVPDPLAALHRADADLYASLFVLGDHLRHPDRAILAKRRHREPLDRRSRRQLLSVPDVYRYVSQRARRLGGVAKSRLGRHHLSGRDRGHRSDAVRSGEGGRREPASDDLAYYDPRHPQRHRPALYFKARASARRRLRPDLHSLQHSGVPGRRYIGHLGVPHGLAAAEFQPRLRRRAV